MLKKNFYFTLALAIISLSLYPSNRFVFAAPPTITITIAGYTLVAEGAVLGGYTYTETLQWSSNGTSCTIAPGNFSGISGSQEVSFTSDTVYTATCVGSGGTSSASATVIVPTGSLSEVSVSAPNSTVTLTWTSGHNPDVCRVYDGVTKFSNFLGSGGATGSIVVNNVST